MEVMANAGPFQGATADFISGVHPKPCIFLTCFVPFCLVEVLVWFSTLRRFLLRRQLTGLTS